MGKIDYYKSSLGYGARHDLWEIEMQFPASLLAVGLLSEVFAAFTSSSRVITINTKPTNLNSLFSIMCHEVNFPKTPDIETETLAYEGSYFDVAKNRKDYDDITIKFRDDASFTLRNTFEVWLNYVQNLKVGSSSGVMNSPKLYKTDTLKIYSLDNNMKRNRRVDVVGAFPIAVSGYELDYTKHDIIETSVTFSVDSYDVYGKSITTDQFKKLSL